MSQLVPIGSGSMVPYGGQYIYTDQNVGQPRGMRPRLGTGQKSLPPGQRALPPGVSPSPAPTQGAPTSSAPGSGGYRYTAPRGVGVGVSTKPPTAQSFLRGNVGKLLGGLVRIPAAQTILDENASGLDRGLAGVTILNPLAGYALEGAAYAPQYGGMTELTGGPLLTKVDRDTPSTETSKPTAQLSRTPPQTATEEIMTTPEASTVPPNVPLRQPETTPGLQPGINPRTGLPYTISPGKPGSEPLSTALHTDINPRTGLPYTISPGKPGFEPGREISDGNPQPLVSKAERLAQEREAVGLTPMQQWAMANERLAQKVGENQSGYDEIQAYFEAQDTGRTPEEMLAIRVNGNERAFDGTMETSTPLAGRNTMAPAGDFPQYGTQMSGSYASIALPGTAEGLSQLFLTPGQVQMPDANSKINIDDFYGAGNLVADGLDMERFLPFPNIETEPELNRIINLIRRKK